MSEYERSKKIRDEFRAFIEDETQPLGVPVITFCLEAIKAISDDDEWAHSMEDNLRHRVLKDLAKAGSIAAEMVLTSSDIEFARWCA